MAYLVLVISIIYTLLWGLGLFFSLRSDGKKTLWIPVLGLVFFIGLTVSSVSAVQYTMANPSKLTAENYLKLKLGQSLEQTKAFLGEPQPDEREFDFNVYQIRFPTEVAGKLRGDRHHDEVDATLSFKISGEPSKANLRRGEGLGAPATSERNGLMGVEIVLQENGNEFHIVEGVDWNYEDDMTAEDVAKKLGEVIDAHEDWIAEGSPDSDPRSVIITPEKEENGGTVCNEVCSGRVAIPESEDENPTPTSAIIMRSYTDGSEVKFRGGEDETFVKIWEEPGRVMDADFSTTNKMIIIGFVKDKLVGISQVGLDLPPEALEALSSAE